MIDLYKNSTNILIKQTAVLSFLLLHQNYQVHHHYHQMESTIIDHNKIINNEKEYHR